MNSRDRAGAKPSFKAQMLAAREEAILLAVNGLLARKGFDAMTVDEVAAEVGIAKASLYKHFQSKEDLAATAIARVLGQAQAFLAGLDASLPPRDKLEAALRWALRAQLAGQLPPLPGQGSSLRAFLLSHQGCRQALAQVSARLVSWIEAAQAAGALNPKLPAQAVACILLARACDPAVDFLRTGGAFGDEEIVAFALSTCFDGLDSR